MPAHRKFDREHTASIVMEAIHLGLPLIATVMEVFDVSDNSARYMIRIVREEGLIGAGQHKPARAVIHRGAPGEKTWIVCQICTSNWPCAKAFPYGKHTTQGVHLDGPSHPEQPERAGPGAAEPAEGTERERTQLTGPPQ